MVSLKALSVKNEFDIHVFIFKTWLFSFVVSLLKLRYAIFSSKVVNKLSVLNPFQV